MSGRGFIAPEPARRCELCGKTAECRPYGPHGEQVCYQCGMKDEAAVIQAFTERVLGEKISKKEARKLAMKGKN